MSNPTFDPSMFGGEKQTTADVKEVTGGGDDTYTLADYGAIDVSESDANEVLAGELPYEATYQTDPDRFGPLAHFDRPAEVKDRDGNVIDHRQVVRFVGRMVTTLYKQPDGKLGTKRAGEAVESESRIQIDIAAGKPNFRQKRDFNTGEVVDGKYDRPSLLFGQVVAAFKATHKEPPKNLEQMVEFLANGVYRVSVGTMNDPRKPAREGREPDGEARYYIRAISPVRR